MDENVVLCVVCSWRSVCKKKYSVSGIEIFNCPDFSRDVSITISGIEELMNFINNFKNDRLN